MVARALLLAFACLALACSSSKPRPVEDARPLPPRPDAAIPVDAAPAPKLGAAQIRVEWRDVPLAARASPGRTSCGTPRAPAVAPTATWGIPGAILLVENAPTATAEARVVFADCAFAPRAAAGSTLLLESAVDRPTTATLAKRAALASLDALAAGTPRSLRLPIAGHTVSVALEPGAVYELAAPGADRETAWLVAPPAGTAAAITDDAGEATLRELAPGPHAVTAWLPPRAGQPARLARGTVTVVAGDVAALTLSLAPLTKSSSGAASSGTVGPVPKSTPWTVAYHDGSANEYQIESDGDGARFKYVPVTPERSSTGQYSGGPPRAGRLDARGVESLWTHIREFESDVSLHSDQRMKGTGAFELTDATGTRKFIIHMGPRLGAFDAFLAALR